MGYKSNVISIFIREIYRYFGEKTGTYRFYYYFFFFDIGNNLLVRYNWDALVIRIMHPSNGNIIIHGNTGIFMRWRCEYFPQPFEIFKPTSFKPTCNWTFPLKNFHEFNDTKIDKEGDTLMIFKANNFLISKKKKRNKFHDVISRFDCRNAFELKNRATNHAND